MSGITAMRNEVLEIVREGITYAQRNPRQTYGLRLETLHRLQAVLSAVPEHRAEVVDTHCKCHPETCGHSGRTLVLDGVNVVEGQDNNLKKIAYAINASWRIDNLCARLQQKCSDWGTYWRAPDAHGVILNHDQALELLRDALGVEVEIKQPELPPVATCPDCFNVSNQVAGS